MMHVLIARGTASTGTTSRAPRSGFDRAGRARAARGRPSAVAPIVGLPAGDDRGLRAPLRGDAARAFIRIGIGLSRHDNGGMTCRTLACLPALTGAYADPARRRAALVRRRRSASTTRCSSARTCMPAAGAARDQHDPARARAHRSGRWRRRSRRSTSTARTRPPSARTRRWCCTGSRARTSSRWCTSRCMTDTARLRRSRAAGHHLDGARGPLPLVRPVLRAARPSRCCRRRARRARTGR